MLKHIAGYLITGVCSALAAVGSTVAILGYRAPSSFPVVKGIDAAICQPSGDDEPSVGDQEHFLATLERFNHQVVFINDITIYNYTCFSEPRKRTREELQREALANESFEFVEGNLKGNDGAITSGSITIGLRKLYRGDPGIWLVVGAPGKDDYFSDTSCGENCFAAHGLYRIRIHSSEGYTIYHVDPFPATSTVFDAYQCTLDRMAANTAWQRFTACRF